MAVARELVRGARVLKARAGKTLKFTVSWTQTDPVTKVVTYVPMDDYTAQLQIRDVNNSRKVLLNVTETLLAGGPLTRFTDEDSHEKFLIYLGKTYTSWLPESSLIECELINNTDPDDVVGLFSLVLKMHPEGVSQ